MLKRNSVMIIGASMLAIGSAYAGGDPNATTEETVQNQNSGTAAEQAQPAQVRLHLAHHKRHPAHLIALSQAHNLVLHHRLRLLARRAVSLLSPKALAMKALMLLKMTSWSLTQNLLLMETVWAVFRFSGKFQMTGQTGVCFRALSSPALPHVILRSANSCEFRYPMLTVRAIQRF